jgi:ATP-binding cassette subfamily G (WHITE) protein 2
MGCLHNLSRQGRKWCTKFCISDRIFFFIGTIIFSIHQPRYSIFKLFDNVLFLSAGQNIYLGPPTDVLPYFASHGFKCEEHDNPADFVLDVLIESSNRSSNKLQTAYLRSAMYSNICTKRTENENLTNCLLKHDTSERYTSKLYYVAQRTLCNVIRNPALFTSQIVSVIIYSFFTGIIFNKLETTVDPGVYNRFGVIFFIISCQVLSATIALEPLINERALFIHVNL